MILFLYDIQMLDHDLNKHLSRESHLICQVFHLINYSDLHFLRFIFSLFCSHYEESLIKSRSNFIISLRQLTLKITLSAQII